MQRPIGNREPTFDACVVGGGPAGSTIAIRLANLGHRVCLVERAKDPRSRVGESLSPGVWDIFDALGLGEAPSACLLRPHESFIRWSEPEVEQHHAANLAVVDRGKFDALLLRFAKHRNVQIFQPARIAIESRGLHRWQFRIASNTHSHSILAKFLVDASGRAGFWRRCRKQTSSRTLAISGLFGGESCPAATLVEALPEGWCWGAPIPDGPYRAMLFVDRDSSWPLRRTTLEVMWRSALARTELFSSIASLPLMNALTCCDATTYFAEDPIGEDHIRIGEASFTLDPLSSTGVEKAMHTGLIAAAAIHTLLVRPERTSLCKSFYQARQMEAVSVHGAWSKHFYRQVRRFQDRPFWQRRGIIGEHEMTRGVVSTPQNKDVSTTFASKVRLSAQAAVYKEACLVGDEICSMSAVSHPTLDRPVAFLGGVEVGLLLEVVLQSSNLGELISLWSQWCSSDQAIRIATWLLNKQILEPLPHLSTSEMQCSRPGREPLDVG